MPKAFGWVLIAVGAIHIIGGLSQNPTILTFDLLYKVNSFGLDNVSPPYGTIAAGAIPILIGINMVK